MKKYWEWLKNNITTVLFGIIAILGAGIFWRYHKKRIGELEDNVVVKEAKIKIAKLEGAREKLSKNAVKHEKDIAGVDKQLLKNKREIVEAHEYTETLTDEQVLSAFRELGY